MKKFLAGILLGLCTLIPTASANPTCVLMRFTDDTRYDLLDSTQSLSDLLMEKMFATVLGCEDALVRPQIMSGTHALSLVLFGILRYGDTMISISGKPYDTMDQVIGFYPREFYCFDNFR